MDCNFLCSLPLSGVDINIDVCMCAAGGRIEPKNKRAKKKEKKLTKIMLRKASAHVLIKQKTFQPKKEIENLTSQNDNQCIHSIVY